MVENVKDFGDEMVVKIPDAKMKITKMYPIFGAFAEVIRKYSKLRPKRAQTNRFLLNYQHGKCSINVVGKNRICQMPKEIASFLNLPNPKEYTAHSFRRGNEDEYESKSNLVN